MGSSIPSKVHRRPPARVRGWRAQDREKIEAARGLYDQGLVELATGRDEDT